MKTIITVLLVLFATSALAADMSKVGFRAYSTATGVTCTVLATADKQKSDNFATRQYALGTKGFGNFSAVMSSGRWNNIKFTCVDVNTSTLRKVKVYFNGTETHFLTLDSDSIVSGR